MALTSTGTRPVTTTPCALPSRSRAGPTTRPEIPSTTPASPPAWGKPTCKEWWENGTQGLREKLINEADATSAGFSGLVVAVAPILTSEQQEDAALLVQQ